MYPSERFLRDVERALKHERATDDGSAPDRIYELAVRSLPPLPEPMKEDLVSYFLHPTSLDTGDEVRARAEYFSAVVDLFACDYDTEADPLRSEDWAFLRELVNDFAVELDMTIVNYVMRLVVDHHQI